MSDKELFTRTLPAVAPASGELVGPYESGDEPVRGSLDEQLHEAEHGAALRSEPPGYVVAFRYRLLEILGQGGHGAVWEARDLVTGDVVAVKLFDTDQSAVGARICREVASLRMLRLPGVVKLLDEGSDGGSPFLVMERVQGTPFPGVPLPVSWERIAPAVLGLLETLSRVHASGIVHRDLKPANVLVDAEGRPTILDFGLARETTPLEDAITGDGIILGTPAYLAPEQVRGGAVTPATDLYSVGIILFEALAGRGPHTGDNAMKVLFARLNRPAPPLAGAAPQVPGFVAAVVDKLLAMAPEDRPQSAEEVLEKLRPERPAATSLSSELREAIESKVRAALAGPEGLRAVFAGHDRLFHIPEDAARIVEERSTRQPGLVAEQLAGWVRAGLARWDGARITVERDVLERLEAGLLVLPSSFRRRFAQPPRPEQTQATHRRAALAAERGTPERLYRLLAGAGDDPAMRAEVVAEAFHLGQKLAIEGRLGLAQAAVSEGLRADRHLARSVEESSLPLLSLAVEIAIEDGTPRALDRALYELYRTAPRSAASERLVQLVRASLALAQRTDRAFVAATSLGPFADVRLERRRQELRVVAARLHPRAEQEAMIEELRAWAEASGDAEARGAAAGWLGRLRYRQARFAEAAELYAEAAAAARWVTARLLALLRVASARLEAFQLEAAAQAARQAREAAQRHRLPFHEAQAVWIVRSIAHRTGAEAAPDLALVEAAAQISLGDTEALHCLNEATIAFRAGDLALGRELSQRARRAWAALGEMSGGGLLAAALHLACGGEAGPEEAQRVVDAALGCEVAGIGIQVLGLLAMAGKPPGASPEQLAALAAQVPAAHWAQRFDILSVREALDAVDRCCCRS